MAKRWSKPKWVVRKASFVTDEYLQPNGVWGPYETSERFKSQEEASFIANACNLNSYGLFACSVPRLLKKRKA